MQQVDITVRAKRQLSQLITTTTKAIKSLRKLKTPSQDISELLEVIEDFHSALTVLHSELRTSFSVRPYLAERLELLSCEHGLFQQCNEALYSFAQDEGRRTRIISLFRRKVPKLEVQGDETSIRDRRIVVQKVHVHVNRTIESLTYERKITSTSKETSQFDHHQSVSDHTQQMKEEPSHQRITEPQRVVPRPKTPPQLKAMEEPVHHKNALPSAAGNGVLSNSIYNSAAYLGLDNSDRGNICGLCLGRRSCDPGSPERCRCSEARDSYSHWY